MLYMTIYLVMTLGTFARILSMRRDGQYVETIADLSGLRTQPAMAFFLAVMMFSLAGIPPLAGFFANFYVFARGDPGRSLRARGHRRADERVGAFYYLRIVKIMYFDEPARRSIQPGTAARMSSRCRPLLIIFYALRSGAAHRRGHGRRQVAVLNDRDRASQRRPVAAGGSIASPASARPTTKRGARAGRRSRRLWIVAREQTQGRGRHGRIGARRRGNLYASALLIDPCDAAIAPQLGFVAGVALASARSQRSRRCADSRSNGRTISLWKRRKSRRACSSRRGDPRGGLRLRRRLRRQLRLAPKGSPIRRPILPQARAAGAPDDFRAPCRRALTKPGPMGAGGAFRRIRACLAAAAAGLGAPDPRRGRRKSLARAFRNARRQRPAGAA